MQKYDLDHRIFQFVDSGITLLKKVKVTPLTRSTIEQVVRSSTSIGANYAEATASSSRKDFINKLHLSKKEIKETLYWLAVLKKLCPEFSDEIELLNQELNQFLLIISKSIVTAKTNDLLARN